jgi:hypothetical protein
MYVLTINDYYRKTMVALMESSCCLLEGDTFRPCTTVLV